MPPTYGSVPNPYKESTNSAATGSESAPILRPAATSPAPFVSKQAIASINATVLHRVLELLPQFSTDGHLDGNEWVALNTRRKDKHPGSFNFNIKNGLWNDLAVADKAKKHSGKGLISYVAHNRNISTPEAAGLVSAAYALLGPVDPDAVSQSATDVDDGWIFQPSGMPPAAEQLIHNKLGTPAVSYTYSDSNGLIAFIVVRWNLPDGDKEVRPLSHWVDNNGASRWRWKQAPQSIARPLYNVTELSKRPEAPVLVVEGEKTAEATRKLLLDYVVVTWAGGAAATSGTDWSPLVKRTIVIWPDHDDAGSTAALSIRTWLEGQETTVRTLSDAEIATARKRVLTRSKLAGAPSPEAALPAGYDAADALAEGWTPDDVTELLTIAALPTGYTEIDGWICKEAGGDEAPPIKICRHIEILAKVRDDTNGAWGRLIRWTDGEGVEHTDCIPMSLLGSDSGELASRLLAGGLVVLTNALVRTLLHELILTSVTNRLLRCVNKVGWHDPIYVIGDENGTVLRPDGHAESVILQTSAPLKPRIVAGTLEAWRTEVAVPCVGNSRLIFAVSLEFAAPLMHLISVESGGFHLVGSSSTGKTTALKMAASVMGTPSESWRTTDNALEAVAAKHNDALLKLDEINECPADRIGQVAYMLANGAGKARMSKSLAAREPLTWRLMFLSTGEISLSDHMRTMNRDIRAGQEVRFTDIPADAGAGMGCFENLHGEANGHAFAERLKQAAREQSGTAGPAFIGEVVRDQPGAIAFVQQTMKKFTDTVVPAQADGQVRRVAMRFALVTAAGELASATGVTGWPSGIAFAAAEVCFRAWMGQRTGGSGSTEEAQILARIRTVIVRDGASAFEALRPVAATPAVLAALQPGSDQRIQNRLGWWRQTAHGVREYLLAPENWKKVFEGMDWKLATATLSRLGHLVPDSSGKGQQCASIPGLGKVRVYVVLGTVVGEAEHLEHQDL